MEENGFWRSAENVNGSFILKILTIFKDDDDDDEDKLKEKEKMNVAQLKNGGM